MTSNENRLRSALHELAGDQAAVTVDVAAFGRRRRTRRWARALATTAVVAAVVSTVGVVDSRRDASPPPPATVPGGVTVLFYRGVQLSVPTAWTQASPGCGAPRADSARVVAVLPDDDCGAPDERSAALTEITLRPVDASLVPGRSTTADGRSQVVRFFSGRGAAVVVTSPDAERAQDYVDQAIALPGTAQVDGCRVQNVSSQPPMVTGSRGSLASSVGVSGGSVCAYDDGWLDHSAALTATQARDVATALAAAPISTEPFPPVDLTRCPDPERVPPLVFTLSLSGAAGQQQLWIYTNGCREAAVANDRGLGTVVPWSIVRPVLGLMSLEL